MQSLQIITKMISYSHWAHWKVGLVELSSHIHQFLKNSQINSFIIIINPKDVFIHMNDS